MIHRLREAFPNKDADNFNPALMEFYDTKPLHEFIVDSFSSIHKTLEEVSLTSWTYTDDVEVDQSSYERTRSNKASDKTQQYAYTGESRLGELTMNFTVDLRDNPIVTKHDFLYFTVKELIPIEVDGCYILNGTVRPIQMQITERSTYVTPGALVCKALMGIMVSKSNKVTVKDHMGETYTLNMWKVNMFSGTANVVLFYLSEMYWPDFLQFFQLHNVIKLEEIETGFDPRYIYLHINGDLYLRVLKDVFAQPYVSRMVGSIMAAMPKGVTMKEIYDKKTWIAQIGATKKSTAKKTQASSLKDSHVELGTRYRKLFNRMLDDASIDAYELTDANKKDILHLVRWLIQEYEPLRAKDNLNILYKRLRRNEVPGSLMNQTISEKIKKFVNTSVKTEERLIEEYKRFFTFKGTEVISKVHRSGLAKWDDSVNDMNIFNRFKVTFTGPNAIGNKNVRNISAKQKSLHPSHIGILSLDICSASNPGMTNYVNPLCYTDGLQFKGRPPEPETFAMKWRDILAEVNGTAISKDEDGVCAFYFKDPVKYNDILDVIDAFKMFGMGNKIGQEDESESTMEENAIPFK